ncbi:MAG: DsbA family oxidoreductase [Leucobacter sp.]|nr:DsbA family oxidoreductase [Leucobacter sp.]
MSDAASTQQPAILVNVWFDVRCPWCFIGKRRLERAIELFSVDHPDIPVTVSHHSFELAPGIAERFDGTEGEYLLRYEGTPLEHSQRMLPELRKLGAAEGVDLRFDELRLVNTRRAHRVFQLAQARGRGEEVLDRFFVAYFSECRDMADSEVLASLAAECGLDRDEALAAADPETGEHWDEGVSADHVRGQMLGASGVPFSLFNAKYRIAGAQTAEVFAEAMREVVRRDFPEVAA